MKRVIVYLVAGALVVVAVLTVGPFRERFRDVRSDLRTISADTGDVMASATYQRFAARREAIQAMRNALLGLAAAESAFVVDSGRPTMFFYEKYRFPSHLSNIGPTIQIEPDRWVATIGNQHTSMTCRITAKLDTTSGQYHAGPPICAGEP